MEILSILVNICSISTLDTVEFEENNVIILRKVNFALMIPNPSLDCSYVVLSFWPNLSLVLKKLFWLIKTKACRRSSKNDFILQLVFGFTVFAYKIVFDFLYLVFLFYKLLMSLLRLSSTVE